MRADSNLPARMTKLARKLMRRRRAEIADEEEDDALMPYWLMEIFCDSAMLPRWDTNAEHGLYYANHRGTLVRNWDGCTRRLSLDLNEFSEFGAEDDEG